MHLARAIDETVSVTLPFVGEDLYSYVLNSVEVVFVCRFVELIRSARPSLEWKALCVTKERTLLTAVTHSFVFRLRGYR